MKKSTLLTASLLFAATMALAQNNPSTGAALGPEQNRNATSQNAVVRGCLTGSPDNYTLTDQNGAQYKLVGDNSSLLTAVGHVVQVNGMQGQSMEGSSGNSNTMAGSAYTFQVSEVKDSGRACNRASNPSDSTGNPGFQSPANHPNDEKTPKGTSPESSDQPHGQLTAMLQQSSNSPMSSTGSDAAQSAQSNSSSTPSTPSAEGTEAMPSSKVSDSGQSTGVGQATQTPPVTSQTPASPTSPTSPSSQTQTSPANTAGTTPQSNTSQPQNNANDSNKPLWERQATDIPWARKGGTNTGTSSTTGNANSTTNTPNTNTNSTTTNPNNPH